MLKIILFDCDGPIIKRDKYFSQRLLDLGININKQEVDSFFKNEFLLCETGKTDLKQELLGRIQSWGWNKSLEELLDFWFTGEAATDSKMIESIKKLRAQGIECHLVTDQEKYRAEYIWNIVGLKNVLDKMYSSNAIGFLKTQMEFWENIYKNFQQYSKEEILVVDDDSQVISTAKQFGFQTQLYTTFEQYQKITKS